jgi:hypothetical protein
VVQQVLGAELVILVVEDTSVLGDVESGGQDVALILRELGHEIRRDVAELHLRVDHDAVRVDTVGHEERVLVQTRVL